MIHPTQAVLEISCEVAGAKTPGAVPLVLQAVRDLVHDEREALYGVDSIGAEREVDSVAVGVPDRVADDVARDALADADPAQIKPREERREQRHDLFRQTFDLSFHRSAPKPIRIARVSISAKNSTSGCVSILKAASSARAYRA